MLLCRGADSSHKTRDRVEQGEASHTGQPEQVPASALAGKNSRPLFSCSPGGRFVGGRDVHTVRLSQKKGLLAGFVCALRRGEGGFKKQQKQTQSM